VINFVYALKTYFERLRSAKMGFFVECWFANPTAIYFGIAYRSDSVTRVFQSSWEQRS